MSQPNESQLRTTLQRQLENYRKNLLSCPAAQRLAFGLLIEQAERELEALNQPTASPPPRAATIPPPPGPTAAS
ncbi:MAG: hypothetical protein JWM97_107 [Phycisphaerales bacterium]|nr:hypothetical protein [Phycisphaerales bacterium]